MDIRQLNYFVAVYEQGSVSAAARHCCVAQPSLSTALRQLEQELGATLFLRQPKGVTPTDDGEKLYGHAGRLLAQLQSLKSSFSQPVERVKFRLGLIRALGVERMSQLLREFCNNLPGLELHLVEPDEQCDARIVTPQQVQAAEAFQAIWHDNYLLAIPPGSALALKDSLELTDFEGLALIKRTPCDAWNTLYPELIRRGIKPDLRANIQTIEYALGLVSAGVGCALVPNFGNVQQRNDLITREIKGLKLERTIGLAYLKNANSAPLSLLLQQCQQAVGR